MNDTRTHTKIEPPTRLAFTWIWDGDDARQLIELDFEESDGVTTVRFTHSRLWDEESVRSHENGWSKAFRNLERTLASGQVPPRHDAWRPVLGMGASLHGGRRRPSPGSLR